MEIRKSNRGPPRSVNDAELGHFTLLFCIRQQRNVQRGFNAHAQPLFWSLNLVFDDALVAVVVADSVSDLQSSGPGFESRSDHFLDLLLGSPEFKSSVTLVNSQLVCLRPVGILNNVMFSLKYLFQLFA